MSLGRDNPQVVNYCTLWSLDETSFQLIPGSIIEYDAPSRRDPTNMEWQSLNVRPRPLTSRLALGTANNFVLGLRAVVVFQIIWVVFVIPSLNDSQEGYF